MIEEILSSFESVPLFCEKLAIPSDEKMVDLGNIVESKSHVLDECEAKDEAETASRLPTPSVKD